MCFPFGLFVYSSTILSKLFIGLMNLFYFSGYLEAIWWSIFLLFRSLFLLTLLQKIFRYLSTYVLSILLMSFDSIFIDFLFVGSINLRVSFLWREEWSEFFELVWLSFDWDSLRDNEQLDSKDLSSYLLEYKLFCEFNLT